MIDAVCIGILFIGYSLWGSRGEGWGGGQGEGDC